jgi:hypothetical protein
VQQGHQLVACLLADLPVLFGQQDLPVLHVQSQGAVQQEKVSFQWPWEYQAGLARVLLSA